jgi:mono/diheme cytochrome c family protein
MALTLALIAGCGGGGGGDGGGGAPKSGAQVFSSAGCGGCHTLSAAHANGTVGPNLDKLRPAQATVERQVRNGGGGMPAFGSQLSDAEIKAVARYVAKESRRR